MVLQLAAHCTAVVPLVIECAQPQPCRLARLGCRHCNAAGGERVGLLPAQVHVIGANEPPPMAEPRDDRDQVLAPARRDGLLTIMTPVFPDNETLALLHNQVGFRV